MTSQHFHSSQAILVHQENGICTLTFNRPEKKNSITAEMYQFMADTLTKASEDLNVCVVVFQGNEHVFSAGNDLADFLNEPPKDENAPVYQFLSAISSFSKPLLASVCGPAVGIGTTLLLHCDLVYAGDNAAFSLPFVNLGLCPEAASSFLLPQIMGYQRAAQALLLGEPFTAETALEVGLINRIVAPNECNEITQKIAQKLAQKPISALIETKRLMKNHQMPIIQNQIGKEARVFSRLLQEPAAKEAFSAFLEKRPKT